MNPDELFDETRNFATQILPLLALHYRREELNELERNYPWLKAFRSVHPNFNEARDLFFSDGIACIKSLETHIELMRFANANQLFTAFHGCAYSIFMAKLCKIDRARDISIRKISSDFGDNYCQSLIDIAQHERDAIKNNVSAAGLTYSDDCFLEAGQ